MLWSRHELAPVEVIDCGGEPLLGMRAVESGALVSRSSPASHPCFANAIPTPSPRLVNRHNSMILIEPCVVVFRLLPELSVAGQALSL